MQTPSLTKAKAKEILQQNFGSIEVAADKLEDIYLVKSFESKQYPVTLKVINYLSRLDYNTTLLFNTCSICGISYTFTGLCLDTRCRYCSNKDKFFNSTIIEPNTISDLIVNLKVLSDFFDHEDTPYKYSREIEYWETVLDESVTI